MPTKEQTEARLLYRYDRTEDGGIVLARPYHRGTRDEKEMLQYDCLAFEEDLSKFPEKTRDKLLDFEAAYVMFYRVWTGSGNNLPPGVSRSLDHLQTAFEGFRDAVRDAPQFGFSKPEPDDDEFSED